MKTTQSENIFWQKTQVDRSERAKLFGHQAKVLWFTGLSGSGKSTIAFSVEKALYSADHAVYLLDGDNVRHGLCKDLGFSPADRSENIRRIGEVAKLMLDAGLLVLCAFVSPYQADRDQVRSLVGKQDFIEIFVETPLSVCEERDVKGLYARARAGEIASFTGISSPYELPKKPDLVVNTHTSNIKTCVQQVLQLLDKKCAIKRQIFLSE